MNTTADILSCLEIDQKEQLSLEIPKDVPTQLMEVTIQSTETTQEDQDFFFTENAQLSSEEQLWQRKQEKCNAVHTEPTVITVPLCYIEYDCTNTLMQSMESFNKVPRLLIERNAERVLLDFKRQIVALPLMNKSSEQTPDTSIGVETKNAS